MENDLLRSQQTQGVAPDEEKLPINAPYDRLEAMIPEVAAMRGFDQRNDFHSLTLDKHTKRVVRGLEGDSFVMDLPERQRALLVLAGKLHDLGKVSPDGQQIHPKDPEKRQYVGHEGESERILRDILPRHFDLKSEEIEFVAKLAGLHAAALNLIGNFRTDKQPKGKALGAYDKFFAKAEEIPGDLALIDKMRMVFALNRADKSAGYDESSDMNDPKVMAIKARADEEIAILRELEKALPALIAAIGAKRSGDQAAGITFENGEYVYRAAEKKPAAGMDEQSIGCVLSKFGELGIESDKRDEFSRILREEGFSGLGKAGFGRQIGAIKKILAEAGK